MRSMIVTSMVDGRWSIDRWRWSIDGDGRSMAMVDDDVDKSSMMLLLMMTEMMTIYYL